MEDLVDDVEGTGRGISMLDATESTRPAARTDICEGPTIASLPPVKAAAASVLFALPPVESIAALAFVPGPSASASGTGNVSSPWAFSGLLAAKGCSPFPSITSPRPHSPSRRALEVIAVKCLTRCSRNSSCALPRGKSR